MNLLGEKTGGRFPVKNPPTYLRTSDSARTHRSVPVLLRHSRHITGRSRSEAKQLQGTKQPRAKQPRKKNHSRAADASLTANSRKHAGENIGLGMLAVTYSSSLGLMAMGDGTRRRTPPARRRCTESGSQLVCRDPCLDRRYLYFFLHRERELRC